jgi:phosphatidylglycerol:prolipoprotein diacylglycerol transferase
MLGIAFIVASYLLSKEFKRNKLPENYAFEITLISVILGVAGSKLLYVMETWAGFIADPIGMLFSPGGLTFYGGFILTTIGIGVYIKRKKLKFLFLADLISPSLAIAYGIGRIGCHLAGDGDYGIPTTLPWGVNYENGLVKPTELLSNSKYALQYPNHIFPNNVPLHPTPVYEFLMAVVIFSILWYYRTKIKIPGRRFMLYLILSGIARLWVEFLRLNQPMLWGLTEAQLISIILIIVGAAGWFLLPPAPVVPIKGKQKKSI